MRSLVASIACLTACSSSKPPPLSQEAYVWQRRWAPTVHEAVATAPSALAGLRVLVSEVDPARSDAAPTVLPLDADALAAAHRPITLVIRIDGSRPVSGLSLEPVITTAQRFRTAGIDVAGIEIDHDCATARLADYATWLAAHRPVGFRYSITALPTWAGSPAVREVAAAVDELVVQVHAVRAPTIFDPAQAREDLEAFAAAAPGAHLRVALPTYRVWLAGKPIEVDPSTARTFVGGLLQDPIPGVEGIVWFRLPVPGDDDTWPTETFAAVLERRPRAATVTVVLRSRGNDLYDIVASNSTSQPAELPPVRLAGDVDAAELVGGYTERTGWRFRPPHRRLPAGATQDIGWVRGKAPRVTTD